MNGLWTHLSFTQLRFHCSKHHGRTFHVITAANSTGEAVVQYFSGQTDIQLDPCGSFVRMGNDNSKLAGACGGLGYFWARGRWGRPLGGDKNRLLLVTRFYEYFWWLKPDYSAFGCVDHYFSGVSSGDFWKVFVR